MINRVVISERALRQMRRIPQHINAKLLAWARAVETNTLEVVRRVPGYHDEPLRGDRRGQRSIRLSRAYRAIYVVRGSELEFVEVEEVSKHDY